MKLYQRPGNRVPVKWSPSDETAGREAVSDVVGEPDEWPAEVDNDDAAAIRARYYELTGETK